MYNKDKTILVKYINANEGTVFTTPDTVRRVESNVFVYNDKFLEAILTENVKAISNFAFNYYFPGKITILNPACIVEGENATAYNSTLYGWDESIAQDYAEKYGRQFS